VVLRLAPAAQWVVGEYPHHEATEDDKGQWTVRLPVASPAWLARLLLRLGPQVEILEAPQELGEVLRSKAASRVLDRMTQERHLSGSSGD
jgi:predicted DNA-binding transcriptional regulator YafY